MDLTVPGAMGGQETIRLLKKLDPGVSAIVASGYSNDPVMSRYKEYGFVNLIAKPFKPNQLLEVLRASIEGRG